MKERLLVMNTQRLQAVALAVLTLTSCYNAVQLTQIKSTFDQPILTRKYKGGNGKPGKADTNSLGSTISGFRRQAIEEKEQKDVALPKQDEKTENSASQS